MTALQQKNKAVSHEGTNGFALFPVRDALRRHRPGWQRIALVQAGSSDCDK
jgi:hypothetical protein